MTKRDDKQDPLERVTAGITRWVGSTSSIVIHTVFFAACFALVWLGADLEKVLLTLTTVVSLEAIYLALFIQMTVNRASESLEAVEEDIDEIQEDVAGIEKDIDEIQEDIDEIEKDDEEWEKRDVQDAASLKAIEARLSAIVEDLEKFRKQ